jgi:hypothetical protein
MGKHRSNTNGAEVQRSLQDSSLYRYYLEAENPSPSEIFWRYLNQTVSKLMPEADQMNWANSMAIYWLKDTPDQHC